MNKKTVCVDLDGTLATYTGWQGDEHIGDPRPGAAEFMTALAEAGCRVVVFTTRTKCDDAALGRGRGATPEVLAARVRDWLTRHRIPFNEVYTGQGKPIGSAYVDDRAVAIPTNPSAADFEACLKSVRSFLP